MLEAVTTLKKRGYEPFTYDKNALQVAVLSFWQWSNSELLGNALRGTLAEFIVASSINALASLREDWDAYDIVADNGLKIEIKSSSYFQSWKQNKLSEISFGIQPTGVSKTRGVEKRRKADIYVFCVLSNKDKSTVNPLNLNQWDFYILPTSVLNKELPKQKKINLSSLLKLNPSHVKYNELGAEINRRDKEFIKVATG